jgi:hypothetical protein
VCLDKFVCLIRVQIRKTQSDIDLSDMTPAAGQMVGQSPDQAADSHLPGEWQPGYQSHKTEQQPGWPAARPQKT